MRDLKVRRSSYEKLPASDFVGHTSSRRWLLTISQEGEQRSTSTHTECRTVEIGLRTPAASDRECGARKRKTKRQPNGSQSDGLPVEQAREIRR